MNAVFEVLQEPLLTLIQGATAIAVPFVLYHFNSWIKAKSHDARFHCAMDKMMTHAQTAVLNTTMTFTKGVRESGKWDETAAQQAKQQALQSMRTLLGQTGVKEMMGCLGQDQDGLNEMFAQALEAVYSEAKAAGTIDKLAPRPKQGASDGASRDGAPPSG